MDLDAAKAEVTRKIMRLTKAALTKTKKVANSTSPLPLSVSAAANASGAAAPPTAAPPLRTKRARGDSGGAGEESDEWSDDESDESPHAKEEQRVRDLSAAAAASTGAAAAAKAAAAEVTAAAAAATAIAARAEAKAAPDRAAVDDAAKAAGLNADVRRKAAVVARIRQELDVQMAATAAKQRELADAEEMWRRARAAAAEGGGGGAAGRGCVMRGWRFCKGGLNQVNVAERWWTIHMRTHVALWNAVLHCTFTTRLLVHPLCVARI